LKSLFPLPFPHTSDIEVELFGWLEVPNDTHGPAKGKAMTPSPESSPRVLIAVSALYDHAIRQKKKSSHRKEYPI
jgi:hypothetical protein